MAGDDERPVFETHLHLASLGGTMAFAASVVGATALVVHRNPLAPSAVAQLWVAALVVIVLGAAAPLARWRRARFSVSPDRLTIRAGGFRAQRIDIPLARVAEISVRPG